jgi:hypothetical protein
MRIWNPDRVSPSSPNPLRDRVEEKAKHINEAFDFLKNNYNRYSSELFIESEDQVDKNGDLVSALSDAHVEICKLKIDRDAAQRKARAEFRARQRVEKIASEAQAQINLLRKSQLELARRLQRSLDETELLKRNLVEAERWQSYWKQRADWVHLVELVKFRSRLWSNSRFRQCTLIATLLVIIVWLLPSTARSFLAVILFLFGFGAGTVYFFLNRKSKYPLRLFKRPFKGLHRRPPGKTLKVGPTTHTTNNLPGFEQPGARKREKLGCEEYTPGYWHGGE